MMNTLLTLLLLPVIAFGAGAVSAETASVEAFDDITVYASEMQSADVGGNERHPEYSGHMRSFNGTSGERIPNPGKPPEVRPVPSVARGSGDRRVVRQDPYANNGFNSHVDANVRRDAGNSTRRPRTDLNTGALDYAQFGEYDNMGNFNQENVFDVRHNMGRGVNGSDVRGSNRNVGQGSDRAAERNMGNRNMPIGRGSDNNASLRHGMGATNPMSGRINELNNEFSRMFEISEALDSNKRERLMMKLEFEAMKEEYVQRLRGLISENMNQGRTSAAANNGNMFSGSGENNVFGSGMQSRVGFETGNNSRNINSNVYRNGNANVGVYRNNNNNSNIDMYRNNGNVNNYGLAGGNNNAGRNASDIGSTRIGSN